MKRNVKVSVIGGKSAGKTCFLHAAYAVLRRGLNNFFLHASDLNEDNRLMKSWNTLSKSGDHKWPPSTPEDLLLYHFTFKRGLTRTLLDFEWTDYRGSILQETSDAASQLIGQFHQSDVIFFCVDGAELSSPVSERLFEIDNTLGISRAKVMLDGLQKRVPIVVVITKCDLCKNRYQNELIRDAEILFDAWLTKGEGWDVMICPITLGMELDESFHDAPISPKNVHLPLIYSIFSMQIEVMMEIDRELKKLRDARTQAEKKIQQLSSGFFAEMVNRPQIEEATREATYATQQIVRVDREAQRVRSDLAALGAELSKAVMYSNGERVAVAGA